MTVYHWTCLGRPPHEPPCGAGGQYDHKAQTGDSGEAFKHGDATGHATNSHAAEWAA